MADEREPGVDQERERNAFVPDGDRPGSDMGTGYAEVAEDEDHDDDRGELPGVGDVYRSGS